MPKCRVLANPIDPQLSRAILDDAAGNQPLAAAPPHRGGFAGQQRLVDAAVRAFEDTVGRHHAAFVDVHPVPDRELVHPDALERAVGAATQRVRWREAGERVGQVAGMVPRPHFEMAAGQQEEHEHRHRVEVHVTAAAQASIRLAA